MKNTGLDLQVETNWKNIKFLRVVLRAQVDTDQIKTAINHPILKVEVILEPNFVNLIELSIDWKSIVEKQRTSIAASNLWLRRKKKFHLTIFRSISPTKPLY